MIRTHLTDARKRQKYSTWRTPCWTALLATSLLTFPLYAQNVGIGTTNPAPSALLELHDTSRGLLIPRLTTQQRNAIANPEHALIIFNVDSFCFEIYDTATARWYPVSCPRNCAPPVCNPTIVGPSFVTTGDTATFFISGCPPVVQFRWRVPSGWTILSGQGTDTLRVIPDTTDGNVSVQVCNICGCGKRASTFVVADTCVSPANTITYTVSPTTFGFTPLSSPTCVNAGDDWVSAPIPLPFPFYFFGNTYNSLYISSNGFITFLAGQPSGCCSGQCLPNTGTPNGLIAGYWEDLNPASGGTICYQTVGNAPNRIFVVQFSNVPHFGGGNNVTFQIKLFECSMNIEIHCQNCPSDGGSHTQGIENPAGNAAYFFPGRNCTSFSLYNDAVLFKPQ